MDASSANPPAHHETEAANTNMYSSTNYSPVPSQQTYEQQQDKQGYNPQQYQQTSQGTAQQNALLQAYHDQNQSQQMTQEQQLQARHDTLTQAYHDQARQQAQLQAYHDQAQQQAYQNQAQQSFSDQQQSRTTYSPILGPQQQILYAPAQGGQPFSSSRDQQTVGYPQANYNITMQQYQPQQSQGQSQVYQSDPSIYQQAQYASGGEMDLSGISTLGDAYSTGGTGEGRLVSITSRVDESRAHIVGEEIIEHQIRVPRRVVREEIFEKVTVVPEVRRTEEIVEDTCNVRERLIKVAKPTIVERVIEVPEVVWVDKIIEGAPETEIVEKIVEIEKVIEQERVRNVPKIIIQEIPREVVDDSLPPIYNDRQIEKLVEVYDWRDEVVITPVEVKKYVDKVVKVVRDVEVYKDIPIAVPLPVEAEVTYEFTMPHLQPNFHKVTYPVYLPRFIEVPVAAELLTPQLNMLAESFRSQIRALENGATTSTASASSTGGGVTPVSLQEIEELATQIMKTDFQTQLQSVDLRSAVMNAWNRGHLVVKPSGPQGQSSSEGPTMDQVFRMHPMMPATTSLDGGSLAPPAVSYGHTIAQPQRPPPFVMTGYNSTLYTPPQSVQQVTVPVPVQAQVQQGQQPGHSVGSEPRRPSFNPLYPMSQNGVKTQAVQNRYRPKGAVY